jgi:hypothetical protein
VRSILVTMAIVTGASLLLAGCSSGSASSASSAAAQPACDAAAVNDAVVAAIGKDQSLRQINGLECKDGWAVISPTIGPPDGSTDGEIDITLVLKAESGTWVNVDRTAVCGTLPTGDGSPAYPSDAQVPAQLWRGACQTN